MTSTFTPNKNLEEPAAGDYVNAWAPPINANFTAIDTSLGGATPISVTGVPAGTISLTLTQYRPPNIEFTGTISGNLNYQIPTGIGGIWTVSNATTGAFTLSFSIAAGNSLVLPAGRTLIVSDGSNIALAQTLAFSLLNGLIAPSQVPIGAVTQYESSFSIAFTQLTGQATTAQLPATAYRGTLGSGNVTVQAGGSPSGGSSGDLFLIY